MMDIDKFREIRKLDIAEAMLELGKFYLPVFRFKHLDAAGIADQLHALFRCALSDKKEKNALEKLNSSMARFIE